MSFCPDLILLLHIIHISYIGFLLRASLHISCLAGACSILQRISTREWKYITDKCWYELYEQTLICAIQHARNCSLSRAHIHAVLSWTVADLGICAGPHIYPCLEHMPGRYIIHAILGQSAVRIICMPSYMTHGICNHWMQVLWTCGRSFFQDSRLAGLCIIPVSRTSGCRAGILCRD